FTLPSLRFEGGQFLESIKCGLGDYASGFSAFMAVQALLPPPEGAPTVRRFQLRQLRISLPWACRELGLPEPDGTYAQIEIDQADREFDSGRITEDEWHARVEEPLIDAYLSYAEPERQSGKTGGHETWRWGRELILDVFPKRATFLDV